MQTVKEALETIPELQSKIIDLENQVAALMAENTLLKSQVTVNRQEAKETIDAKTIKKQAEIDDLKQKKQEVYAKPLTDYEKSELAAAYQRQIESKQEEKLELEKTGEKLKS